MQIQLWSPTRSLDKPLSTNQRNGSQHTIRHHRNAFVRTTDATQFLDALYPHSLQLTCVYHTSRHKHEKSLSFTMIACKAFDTCG